MVYWNCWWSKSLLKFHGLFGSRPWTINGRLGITGFRDSTKNTESTPKKTGGNSQIESALSWSKISQKKCAKWRIHRTIVYLPTNLSHQKQLNLGKYYHDQGSYGYGMWFKKIPPELDILLDHPLPFAVRGLFNIYRYMYNNIFECFFLSWKFNTPPQKTWLQKPWWFWPEDSEQIPPHPGSTYSRTIDPTHNSG